MCMVGMGAQRQVRKHVSFLSELRTEAVIETRKLHIFDLTLPVATEKIEQPSSEC